MAFYNGYITLPHGSYSEWKAAVIGNGYNADGSFGDQCWDLCAEFWYNVGFPQGYPLTGSQGYAYECWTVNRNNNVSYNSTTYFNLITSINDVKQGDVLIWNGTTTYPAGHMGFADEDYNGSGYINILGQNQGSSGTPTPVPNPDGGTTANVTSLSVANFLGAFRYINWAPAPPIRIAHSHFKWALYARRLRQKNMI